MLTIGIALGGIGVLAALGAVIGHALDRKARDDAWRRIATARRVNAERARQLAELEAELEDADDGRSDSRDPPRSGMRIIRVAEPAPGAPGSAV